MDIYLENDSLFDRADTICLSEHLPKLSSHYVDERFFRAEHHNIFHAEC